MIFFCCFSSIKGRPLPRQGSFSWYFFKADHIIYPANFPGLGEALIFFCCFSSIKGRKAGRETPRNFRLHPIAKKKRAPIPDLGPLLKRNAAKFRITGLFPGRNTLDFWITGLFPRRNIAEFQITDLSHPGDKPFLLRAAYIPKRETQKKGSPSATHGRQEASASNLYPLLTDPYSRTIAAAAPRPTPPGNTPSVRRGRYGQVARIDAPSPKSPADSRHTD